MSDELVMRQAAADKIGVHFAKLERLRQQGYIPEAVRVGRFFVFPARKLDAIRARLVRQGHIKEAVGAA